MSRAGAVHNINRCHGRDDLTGPALSPRIAQRTRAGLGLRAGGKLAVELGEQREVRREVELGARLPERVAALNFLYAGPLDRVITVLYFRKYGNDGGP